MTTLKVQYIADTTLGVALPTQPACAHCRLCPAVERVLPLPADRSDLAPGDEVVLRLSTGRIALLLGLVFVFPSVLAIGATILARLWGLSEVGAALCGISGLTAGWGLMSLVSRTHGHAFLPEIVRVRRHA